MIPNSLRGRVAFAAALATACVILLGGGIVSVLVSRAEHAALDRRLSEQANAVELPVSDAITQGVPIDASDFYLRRPEIGTVLRVYQDNALRLVAGSPDTAFPKPGFAGYKYVEPDGRKWRMLTSYQDMKQSQDMKPSQNMNQGDVVKAVVMQVAVPTRATDDVIASLRRQVLIVATVSTALAATAGWFFGEVAMRPLGRLRLTAETISSSRDLGVRVPSTQGPLEVNNLADSFNVMLERIQEASASTEAALASSRAFAGNAAHEMRTPLTSMQANLEVLTKNPDLPPEQTKEIVDAISNEQRRLVRLIDALQTLARGETVADEQKGMVDLADVTGIAIESARRAAPDANIAFDIPIGETEIYGWTDGLRVMVDNLLANGIRHGGGEVSVRLDRENGDLVLAIEDSGSGIPPEDRERIFERFERGQSPRSPGTGLGLALVAQQARLHSGTITVEESLLGGAKFVVRLPLEQPTVPADNKP